MTAAQTELLRMLQLDSFSCYQENTRSDPRLNLTDRGNATTLAITYGKTP